jgi:hypothetical protein
MSDPIAANGGTGWTAWMAALGLIVVTTTVAQAQPAAPPVPPELQPWQTNFFQNDFSYKTEPDAPYFFGQELKDVPLFTALEEDWTASVGGEVRNRYHDERNRLVPGGPGLSSYMLWRWRQYVDVKAGSLFRLYFEGVDASQFGEELPQTAIDVNRWDVQNAFFDLNLLTIDEQPVWFRYGRQELLYGAQRLISPLDFANNRRNFEGFKVFTTLGDWSIDAFAVRPVSTSTGNASVDRFDTNFDSPDQSRTFSAVYASYAGVEDQGFDLYWMWLDEDDPLAQPPQFPDGSRHLVGGRWNGKHALGQGQAFWDCEGGYQFGEDEFGRSVHAGFATGYGGYTFTEAPWTPKLTALYWYGSGDDDPNDGENNTFTPYFPLGHAYWGVIDNLGGPNLQDFSLQGQVQPHEKVTLLSAYHWFYLADDDDVLYNVAQTPLGTPNNGSEIGQELDVILGVACSPNLAFEVQYAEFFYGQFVENALPRPDARQFFIQTSLRY